ncbi:MAG: hypothetical protein SGJ27_20755 [Candidatus Melainabacteria bacterium]|nr:hypothetical protein [Candidatus Melainabacteria bacterium]
MRVLKTLLGYLQAFGRSLGSRYSGDSSYGNRGYYDRWPGEPPHR